MATYEERQRKWQKLIDDHLSDDKCFSVSSSRRT